MLPSISWDLAQTRATLQRLAAEESLTAAARSDLRAVDQVLALVERSWARMAAHLSEDNVRLHAVLADLAGLVPPSLQEDLAVPAPAGSRIGDPEQLAEVNQALRSTLSRVITAAAAAGPETASAVNRLSAGALRAGLGSRPW